TCAIDTPATSNPLTIHVIPQLTPGLTLTSAITGVSNDSIYLNICQGSSTTISVSPVNGGSNPTYVWHINNSLLPGVNTSSYNSNSFNDGDVVSVTMIPDTTCVF